MFRYQKKKTQDSARGSYFWPADRETGSSIEVTTELNQRRESRAAEGVLYEIEPDDSLRHLPVKQRTFIKTAKTFNRDYGLDFFKDKYI